MKRTLDELLESLDDGTIDDDTLAESLLQAVVGQEDGCLLLVPLVKGYVISRRRNEVRALEPRSGCRSAGSLDIRSSSRPVAEIVARRKQLMAKRIYCGPEHGYVLWGEATAAQHRDRAASLRVLSFQVDRTAQLHDRAAEILEAAGAQSLNSAASLRADLFNGVDVKELKNEL